MVPTVSSLEKFHCNYMYMLAKQTQNFANNQQLPKKLQLHNTCAWTINKPRMPILTYKFNQHSMKIIYTQLVSVAIQHRNQISFHHVLQAHHCFKHSNEFVIHDKMIFNNCHIWLQVNKQLEPTLELKVAFEVTPISVAWFWWER